MSIIEKQPRTFIKTLIKQNNQCIKISYSVLYLNSKEENCWDPGMECWGQKYDKCSNYQYYVPAEQMRFSQVALILAPLNFKTSANLKILVYVQIHNTLLKTYKRNGNYVYWCLCASLLGLEILLKYFANWHNKVDIYLMFLFSSCILPCHYIQ